MDLSGIGINKAFKTNLPSAAPYYYITASLDLTGLPKGSYYLNYDNNLSYANVRDYSNYVTIDDNLVISEVVVYSDPEITQLSSPVSFLIGGSKGPVGYNPVAVPWAGVAALNAAVPPYWSWSYLGADDVNSGAVNYFGHEGGHYPYYYDLNGDPDNLNSYKYLTLDITDVPPPSPSNLPNMAPAPKSLYRGVLPIGPPVIIEGRITVVLKVYPKFQ